jgi:hypothetical protein
MRGARSIFAVRLCGLGLLLAVAGSEMAEEPGFAPAPGRRVLTLTPSPGNFNGPSIAINSANPKQMVAAFGLQVTVSYSSDAGEHWALAEGTAAKGYRGTGDISVTYDRRGHAILCFIAFDGAGSWRYWGHNPKRNGIQIRRSLDGGKTWEPRMIPVIQHEEGPGIPFEDKPYVVADNQPKSPYAGNLYVGWTEDRTADSLILFSRSRDGGLTWSAPLRLSDQPGLPRDDEGTVQGFSGVVTPDGALHVVWSGKGHIVYAVSRDGGQTFSRNRWVAEAGPSNFMVFNANHANGYPQIAMAAGQNSGSVRLYVAWNDYRNGDVDIFCASSADGGRTWAPPVRVNSDPLHNGADQLFQWLAVDPASGAVNIIFYDRRRDPANRVVEVALARSTDGGHTFRNYLLSENAFDPLDSEIGEYTALAAGGGRVYGSWMEVAAGPARGARTASLMRLGIADFSGRPNANVGEQNRLATLDKFDKIAQKP